MDGDNFGFRIGHVTENDFFGVFFCSTNAEEEYRPQLVVKYY